ncbi:MAG TPA: nucleoside-diphosphate kinase [Demequinaceae bacterium]
MIERTLLLIKPDAIERRLIGEVIRRAEVKGYDVIALEMVRPGRGILERHYAQHRGKVFFQPLIDFLLSGPLIACVLQGDRVIEGLRSLVGTSDPTTAAPGSIRGDLARDWDTPVYHTLVHGLDSPLAAHAEIELWFPNLPPMRLRRPLGSSSMPPPPPPPMMG